MKISLEWLGDYIDWSVSDPEEIARRITAQVAEVDVVVDLGKQLRDCCVGQVTNLRKHPNADKLSICDVVTDKGIKKVVCGGTNLREGMRVLFAHIGATVLDHDGNLWTLEKATIRGEPSEGMICAASEVGLEALFPDTPEQGAKPIVDLGDGKDGVGEDVRSYLGLNDTVLHIDNHAITHRADLFSHLGFARECVAIGLGIWKKEPVFKAPAFTKDDLPFDFSVKDVALMPRYCAGLIEIDSLGETPPWMKRRLEATGWRSINLPIDITNYVMMDVGVPLHSFDADDIKGKVQLRRAKKGEKITTLDGKDREINEGALILSDDEGIFDLIGIMGGLRSSTKDSTRRIYLHSASLDGRLIRQAMIAMGHRTDAGTTYEKGVPPVVAEWGFSRAAQLMLDLIPGAKAASKLDSFGENGTAEEITLSVDRVNAVLGSALSAKDITAALEPLGFSVDAKKDELRVTVPLWRLKDVTGAHDLIEEIGRVYGYDRIAAVMPAADITPPARDSRLHAMRDELRANGFLELLPLSLVGPELLKRSSFDVSEVPVIANPIGEELSLMQPSVLPRLLEHAGTYRRQAGGTLRTMTAANVFPGLSQKHEFGALVVAAGKSKLKDDPFLLLKQSLVAAAKQAGYALRIDAAKKVPAFAHPGRTADIFSGETHVGQIFEVHPAVRGDFDLEHRAAACLINLETLFAMPAHTTAYAVQPQFPPVTYDETISLQQSVAVGDVMPRLSSKSDLLEAVEVVDLYSDDKMAPGTYKLTLRFTYRSLERTLTDAEAKQAHEQVLKVLA